MSNEQISLEVAHIFQLGANEVRVEELLKLVVKKYMDSLPTEIIGKYRKWKAENRMAEVRPAARA